MLSKFNIKKENNTNTKNNIKQFVICNINDQDYGISILKSKEIIAYNELTLTTIPNTSEFIEGVINLRGDVIPLIDIVKRLNLDSNETIQDKKIIVVSINNTLMAIKVNEVKGIIGINEVEIEKTPDIIKKIDKDYIKGVAKVEDRLLILLNINKIVANDVINNLNGMDRFV